MKIIVSVIFAVLFIGLALLNPFIAIVVLAIGILIKKKRM